MDHYWNPPAAKLHANKKYLDEYSIMKMILGNI